MHAAKAISYFSARVFRTTTAAWEAALPQIPFEADLVYQSKEIERKAVKITGTLTNKLPIDLEDIYLLYADKAYQIAKQWPGSKANAEPLKISIAALQAGEFS